MLKRWTQMLATAMTTIATEAAVAKAPAAVTAMTPAIVDAKQQQHQKKLQQ